MLYLPSLTCLTTLILPQRSHLCW